MNYDKDKIVYFDVGGADFVLEDRWKYLKNEVEIFLFEPDNRSDVSAISNNRVYNFALADKKGTGTLFLTRKPQCSSFLKPNTKLLDRYPNTGRWDIIGEEKVPVKTLDSLEINSDFIKIDTQGTELNILKGGVKHLKSVLGLEIEVSFIEIYKNQPLFGEVELFLRKNGFEFIDFVTEYRYGRKKLNRRGQLAFADALFLKTPETVKDLPKSQQEKYLSIIKAYNKEDLGDALESIVT